MKIKSSEMLHPGLPPFSASPQTLLPWKKWIVGLLLLLSLLVIIVCASLTGLYLTQKHTEKMATTTGSKDGQHFQQTITVNDREDAVLFYVTTDQYSHSVLFDYNQKVIGIRTANRTECSLLKMDEVKTPHISKILKSLHNHENVTFSNTLTFFWRPVREVHVSELGMNVKLFCSGVPIYWGEEVRAEVRAYWQNSPKHDIVWDGDQDTGIKKPWIDIQVC